ncbi:MAG: 50S ribosomal protein L10 [Clostridia bacterium]|nr:50S ribosomal protein L10 [Clostridia bacterium]
MASETILKQKQAQVAELAEKMKDSKIILLTEYRGINVADVTALRASLRKVNTEYCVIKNNITRRALQTNGIEELEDKLEGPVAVILGHDDYLEPLKAVYEYTKDHDFYKIKGGVIDGKVVTTEELITLAKLPSRETLIAKLAGSLLGNITKLAIALDQVQKQKAE